LGKLASNCCKPVLLLDGGGGDAGWASTHAAKVSFKDAHGKVTSDEIRLAVGQCTERELEERDQDNALKAWPEHGLLGTQLGPNKNGKKW
jgi:Icc protein